MAQRRHRGLLGWAPWAPRAPLHGPPHWPLFSLPPNLPRVKAPPAFVTEPSRFRTGCSLSPHGAAPSFVPRPLGPSPDCLQKEKKPFLRDTLSFCWSFPSSGTVTSLLCTAVLRVRLLTCPQSRAWAPALPLVPSPLSQRRPSSPPLCTRTPPEVILVPPLPLPLQGPPLACGGGSCTTSRPAPQRCLLGDPVGPIFSPLIAPPPVPALVSYCSAPP